MAEVENPIPQDILNKVICKDSRSMEEIPGSSVHLMVTSPLGSEQVNIIPLLSYNQ